MKENIAASTQSFHISRKFVRFFTNFAGAVRSSILRFYRNFTIVRAKMIAIIHVDPKEQASVSFHKCRSFSQIGVIIDTPQSFLEIIVTNSRNHLQKFFEKYLQNVLDISALLCYYVRRAFVFQNCHDREGFIMKLRDDYEYTADNRHTSSFYGVFHDRWDRVQKFQEEACKICSTVDYDGLPKRQVAGDSRDE